jgi:Ca2+-binding RTX toxin-like protein
VGASGADFTPTANEVGLQLRVVASFTDDGGNAEQVVSAATAAVNELPVGTVLIDDTTPTLNQLLTATDAFTDANGTVGAVITHQWQQSSDGAVFTDIAGATGVSFTPGVEQVGALLRVVARYTDDQGTAEQVISDATAPVNIVPTGTLLISDTTPTEDQVLTASPGTIADANGIAGAVFSYQWQAGDGTNFSNITGATGASFAPGDAQVGLQLRVIASFTDDQGAVEQAASTATAAVINVNDVPTGAPVISDVSPTEDQLLVASPGTIADDDGTAGAVFTYQWQAGDGTNFSDIGGASAASFAPGDTEVGRQLRVVATYTDGHGTVEQVVSAATAPVINVNDLATGAPAISDTTPTESQLLSASPGTVADVDGITAAVFTYQWQAGDGTTFSDIVGASGADFTPTANEVGLQLRVVASFTDDGGNAEQVVSAATAVVGELIAGTVAEETLSGTSNADLLQGFGGNDLLLGGAGNDTLDGGVGDDWLNGGAGADVMMGGDGNDVFVVDDALDSIVEGAGPGIDTVRASLGSFTLGAEIENLVYTGTGSFAGTGNTLDNVLYGADSGDTLSSLGGADSLMGLGGNDTLDGGDGDDWLNGGEGADVMMGGDGNDVFVVDDVLDSVVEVGGQGVDVVMSTTASYTLGGEIENLVFTGTGSFEGTGNTLDNVVYGGADGDSLAGLAGADSLMGLGGNDTLVGGDGDDWLDGGEGIDLMSGGAGNDTYVVDDPLDSITEEAGQGIDAVMSTAASYTLGAEVENLVFTGTGSFTGTGNGLANVMYGGAESDTLVGLGGVDSLLGQGGNDTLVGGDGDDWLTGGDGNDIFVFATGFGRDRIMDFDANPADGQDLLDVSGLGITAASFAGSVTIQDIGAYTLLNFAGGNSIQLVGVDDATSITASDFLLAA